MYNTLLSLHSLVRWLVLVSMLIAIVRAYQGWLGNKTFSKSDNLIKLLAVSIVHIQFILGLILYFISPVVDYFLNNFGEAVKVRDIRFFGMEHSFMMILGVVLITIGSSVSKRKETDQQKFKALAIWFTIGLLVILSSIPWAFSPLISRPWFRPF